MIRIHRSQISRSMSESIRLKRVIRHRLQSLQGPRVGRSGPVPVTQFHPGPCNLHECMHGGGMVGVIPCRTLVDADGFHVLLQVVQGITAADQCRPHRFRVPGATHG